VLRIFCKHINWMYNNESQPKVYFLLIKRIANTFVCDSVWWLSLFQVSCLQISFALVEHFNKFKRKETIKLLDGSALWLVLLVASC